MKRFGRCFLAFAIAAGGPVVAPTYAAEDGASTLEPFKKQERPSAPGSDHHNNIPASKRRAYFGELHLHTSMSLDAWALNTKTTPEQAYRFGRGETILLPAEQVGAQQGVYRNGKIRARRAWPLDFMAVTDHSELFKRKTSVGPIMVEFYGLQCRPSANWSSCRIDDLQLRKLVQTLFAKFCTEAGLFCAAKRNVGGEIEVLVDPYGACVHPLGKCVRPVEVR